MVEMTPNQRPIRRRIVRILDKIFGRSAINAAGVGARWRSTGLARPATAIHALSQRAGYRSADAVMNSPLGRTICEAWVSALVADGPSIRPSTKNKATSEKLLKAAGQFWNECDADGISALDGFLQRLVRSLVIYGDAFVHMTVEADAMKLKLRLLSPDQVDRSLDRVIGPGGYIRSGIEFDARGRRVAYHVRENPDAATTFSYQTVRVPAEDICHVFDGLFPGQIRGISWLSASLTTIYQVENLNDALLAKFNTAALFGGFIRKPDATTVSAFNAGKDGQATLEPGGMAELPPGYDVSFSNPPNADGAIEFLRSQVRAASVGSGIPYEIASGDLSQVNYASARVGLLEFRRKVTALQKALIVGQLLNKVWSRLLLLEAAAGRLSFEDAFGTTAEWIFTAWQQLDPLKETKANIEAIDANIKSRHEVISQGGRDPEEVNAEIAAEKSNNPTKPIGAPTA